MSAPPKFTTFLSHPNSDSFEKAAQVSDRKAANERGSAQAGLKLEAVITRKVPSFGPADFGVRYVGSQVQFHGALPSQAGLPASQPRKRYREVDLVVRDHSNDLHLNEIKAGGDISKSVEQLKDLSVAGKHYQGTPVRSLTVLTATGSRNTDLASLRKVHEYSQLNDGLPVLVRTDSMSRLSSALSIPDAQLWAERRRSESPHKLSTLIPHQPLRRPDAAAMAPPHQQVVNRGGAQAAAQAITSDARSELSAFTVARRPRSTRLNKRPAAGCLRRLCTTLGMP